MMMTSYPSQGQDGTVQVWAVTTAAPASKETGTAGAGAGAGGRRVGDGGDSSVEGASAGTPSTTPTLQILPLPAHGGTDAQTLTVSDFCTFEAHERGVRALAFSPDGSMLLTGGVGADAKVWEWPCAETGQ